MSKAILLIPDVVGDFNIDSVKGGISIENHVVSQLKKKQGSKELDPINAGFHVNLEIHNSAVDKPLKESIKKYESTTSMVPAIKLIQISQTTDTSGKDKIVPLHEFVYLNHMLSVNVDLEGNMQVIIQPNTDTQNPDNLNGYCYTKYADNAQKEYQVYTKLTKFENIDPLKTWKIDKPKSW